MSIDLVNVTSAALIDWLGSAISGSSIVSVAVVDCILPVVIRQESSLFKIPFQHVLQMAVTPAATGIRS